MIDRNVDFVTPLIKQMTYQGLIDEFFGIQGNIVKIPTALYDQNAEKQKPQQTAYKNLLFNSEKDYIYEKIRYLTLKGATNTLKTKGANFD